MSKINSQINAADIPDVDDVKEQNGSLKSIKTGFKVTLWVTLQIIAIAFSLFAFIFKQ